MYSPISRRHLLSRLAVGGSAGFALQLPGASLALAATSAVADDKRLVVVLLRGALDGLAAVPPVGDAGWQTLRPQAEAEQERFGKPLPLDGTFALHPKLANLHQWYSERQLLVLHAVASPYRERSHFDAQQLLESGGNRAFELQTGWLGRAMESVHSPGVALSPALPLALRGASSASSWAPSSQPGVDPDLLERIARLYAADAPLGSAFNKAREQRGGVMGDAAGSADFVTLARQAGRFLAAPGGPPIAWIDSGGWDTHSAQALRLSRQLEVLDKGLAALREALGARWASTTVLVMTEFGRSAAMNGSGGTDHGTAGAAFLAGGTVAGGRVLADWPGLAPQQLFENRDLRPTLDLRALIKPVLQQQMRLTTAQLDEALPGAPRGLAGLWRG
jgi:uncharacterized protein (DUF1501 family)